jgi:hypothetical protein
MHGLRTACLFLVRHHMNMVVKIDGGALRLSASDVANFLACGHLTRLDLLRARGQLHPPREFDVGFQDLVERGEAHERVVLDRFRAAGWDVAEIGEAPEAEAMRATLEAIRGGADVVYQGAVVADQAADGAVLSGRPDFLVRAGLLPAPDGEPRPDGVHYEVVDAKLARSAKARAVAQVAFYSHLLASGRPGGCSGRSSRLTLGRIHRPFRIPNRLNTVRSAGGVSSAPGAGGAMTTFP